MEKRKVNKTLTHTSTPTELHEWMNDNLDYRIKPEHHLYNAHEVITIKTAHCCEAVDLTFHELQEMNYTCKILYLLAEKKKVIHTTLFFTENDKDWYWFEWAWGRYGGINGPFASLDDGVRHVKERFVQNFDAIKLARLGVGRIRHNMTVAEHLKMVKTWDDVLTL